MTVPILEMRGLSYSVRESRLLGPIDLTLASAGITCILGPNGAGKSLFLSLAHGMLEPSAGSVVWDGAPAAATRQSRGYVFQSSPMLRRSVRANLEFPLVARRSPHGARAALIDVALETARLTSLANQPAAALSGGERQRLALAQAMVAKPRAILLDEPGASLDPASQRALEDMVRQVAASGTKVIMTTHDLAAAKRLADDVVVFINGTVAAQSAADVFFKTPQPAAVADYMEGRL